MITQQELVDRLNQLTLHYNLTWFDIRYDADKAITKINAFMGTKYPKMTDYLTSSDSTYTIISEGTPYEIFPEEYMHSVVIPFIAMEILARDEEFTTVYNKYATDLDDGLFTMFQKEFNRVLEIFRQDPDRGVFFDLDTAPQRIKRNEADNAPMFKFRVHYHVNNPEVILDAGLHFTEDITAYDYEAEATVLGWSNVMLAYGGTRAFTFRGWSRSATQATLTPIVEGTKLIMKSDVHLYADWESISTLVSSVVGEVSIVNDYKASLTYLGIPETVNGFTVKKIASNFLLDSVTGGVRNADKLDIITLPKGLTEIKADAFKNFKGSEIVFYEGDGARPLTIRAGAFTNVPNLYSIVLPANVSIIEAGAFPAMSNKAFTIYCRVLEQNKPDDWADGWYATSGDGIENYTVNVVWGYNV